MAKETASLSFRWLQLSWGEQKRRWKDQQQDGNNKMEKQSQMKPLGAEMEGGGPGRQRLGKDNACSDESSCRGRVDGGDVKP